MCLICFYRHPTSFCRLPPSVPPSSPLLIMLRVCVSPTVVHLQTPLLATEVEGSGTLVRVLAPRTWLHVLMFMFSCDCSRRGWPVSKRTKPWTLEPRGRRRGKGSGRAGASLRSLACLQCRMAIENNLNQQSKLNNTIPSTSRHR